LLATIPANPEYSSLNVAAAVQLFAYELRLAAFGSAAHGGKVRTRATHEELERFFEHLERAMIEHGFLNPEHPKKLMPRLRRLFNRAELEREEVNILRGVFKALTSPKPRRPGKR
jgi:tRNA/rRNA methyltransferase